MVETVEQEALRLLNEAQVERGHTPLSLTYTTRANNAFIEAFCRLIEERRTMEADHQAFREKVSEAVKEWQSVTGQTWDTLSQFIIQPPVDPLVEAIKKALPMDLFEYGGTPRRDEVAEAIAQAVKIERTEA